MIFEKVKKVSSLYAYICVLMFRISTRARMYECIGVCECVYIFRFGLRVYSNSFESEKCINLGDSNMCGARKIENSIRCLSGVAF